MNWRLRRARGVPGSLDSLVDIVTNALGILVLAATLTVLGTRDLRISLGTPMMVEADKRLERVDFDCRGKKVVPIDFSCTKTDRDAILAEPSNVRREEMIGRFNERRVSDAFHSFEMYPVHLSLGARDVVIPGTIVRFLNRPDASGAADDLKAPDGEFKRRLKNLDSRRQWVMFYVRPDSFDAFRTARGIARDAGFQIGWDPITEETLRFGPTGRADVIDFKK